MFMQLVMEDFGGGTWPENIYQMSVTLKGKAYTWAQMATPRR